MSLALLLCTSEDVKRKLPDLEPLLCMHYVTAPESRKYFK